MKILQSIDIKSLNTFGVECNAAYYAEVKSEDELFELTQKEVFSSSNNLVIGGGSNILFTRNYQGIVIKPSIEDIKFIPSEDDSKLCVKVGAGVNWHKFVELMLRNKLYGIENLALIPGNAGSAPVQNIGAYGVEQEQFLKEVQGIDLATGTFRTIKNEECQFGYRDSIFKNDLKDRFIITYATYELLRKPNLITNYGDISRELAKFRFIDPDPKYIFDLVCRIRKQKLPDYNQLGNAGSFFQNPMISREKFLSLQEDYPNIRGFEQQGKVKISAGWLIEIAGWKGRRIGDAGVYEKHALILVNHGNAKGTDILELANLITEDVYNKFGIFLDKEVRII